MNKVVLNKNARNAIRYARLEKGDFKEYLVREISRVYKIDMKTLAHELRKVETDKEYINSFNGIY